MTIESVESSGQIRLVVKGNVKTIQDTDTLKDRVNSAIGSSATSISIEIVDSYILTSSVIGYLAKLIAKSNKSISTVVGNSELFQLLQELNVIELLNVRR
jgi:hypothetical protein